MITFLVKIIHIFFFIGLCFSQVNVQLYQESKLAIGEKPNRVFPIKSTDTTTYRINENIFDIGLSYNNFYFHTQIEHSKYPVFGIERTDVKDMFNNYSSV